MISLRRLGAHPTQSRLVYDFVMSLVAMLFSFFFLAAFTHVYNWGLLALPIVLLFCNALVGTYTRFKMADAPKKLKILTFSLLLAAAAIYFLTSLPAALLVFALLWGPMVLPRVFLNLKRQPKASVIQSALRNKGPVLVVGGAGYIGSHVVDLLLKSGFSVRVLDRLTYGRKGLDAFFSNSSFEFVEGDATDIVKLNMAMNGASACVHLAGLVGDPACAVDEDFTRHTNVIATRMVKEVATSFSVPRFIFSSSCSVYGVSDEPVTEDSPLNPVSLYARTKIDSERELLASQEDDFCVTVLRFATVFGHSQRPRFDLVANLFAAQAYFDGVIRLAGPDQWRPFVHVRDLARAVVRVLKAEPEKVRNQIFNVGDDRLNMTIGDLAKLVQKIVSEERAVEISLNKDWKDHRNYLVSFKRIQALLDFHAETDLEAGIRELVAEFKKGTYAGYRSPDYSNVEMTKAALLDFNDPALRSRLYTSMGN